MLAHLKRLSILTLFVLALSSSTEQVFAQPQKSPEAAQVEKTTPAPYTLERAFNVNTPVALVLIFAFLWGILVSFTPCIYPMIPITAAVLQGQATTSVARNFMLALSYVFGTATVYATLGYIAATTTVIFGEWAGNPWVILFIVLFLLYLAFAMFGFYEIYIPRTLLRRHGDVQTKGSLLYSFIAGAIAGSISSPCLSPALFTVLLYVAQLGRPIIGFLTLFSFALGMGILLLVIGTSSAALALLPKAGRWMVEVKKVFGFLLLGLAVYFITLNPRLNYFGITVPTGWGATLLLCALILVAAGLYYVFDGIACLHGKRPTERPPLSLEEAETMIIEPKKEEQAQAVATCTIAGVEVIIGALLLLAGTLLLLESYWALCGMSLLGLW